MPFACPIRETDNMDVISAEILSASIAGACSMLKNSQIEATRDIHLETALRVTAAIPTMKAGMRIPGDKEFAAATDRSTVSNNPNIIHT